MRIVFIALLLAPIPARGTNPTPVPIAALLRDPNAYAGKGVRITGAAVVRFESVFVCQVVDDLVGDSERCLWMAPGETRANAQPNRRDHWSFPREAPRTHGRFRGEIGVAKYDILGKHDRGDVPPPPGS